MRKVIFLLIASLFITLTACNKYKDSSIDQVDPSDLIVNLNKAELQQRIIPLNYPVTFNSFKSSADVTPAPELWAIAQILPDTVDITLWHWRNYDSTIVRSTPTNNEPVVDTIEFYATIPAFTTTADQILSMTAAAIDTTAIASVSYAYFTSHIRGDILDSDGRHVYGSELFVITYDQDGDDAGAIDAQASIFDNESDYNDLTIDDTRLWITGDNNARGAIIRNPTLTSLNLLGTTDTIQNREGDPTDFFMPKYNMPMLGPSGNSVAFLEDQLWAVAGGQSAGGLVVMDKNDDSRLYTRVDRTNAKHFDWAEDENASAGKYFGAFLYGDGQFSNNNANLRIFNTSNGLFSYIYDTIGADVTEWGKNAIDIDSTGSTFYLYLAMGADGIFKYDINDAVSDNDTTGHTFDKYNGLDTWGGTGLANGLVVHGDFVYVAWGASGLVIFDKNDLDAGPVGQWNGMGSCNYVAVCTSGSREDVLWVGNGTGGMIMLKFVDDIP
jgi:hypothetical protein